MIKNIVKNIKNINNIKSFISNFSLDVQQSMLLELEKIIDTENALLNITYSQEFNQKFSQIDSYGSKYRLLTSGSKNVTDESRLLFMKEFSDESDRFDILSKMVLDENRIKGYNQLPFQNEEKRMEYLRLFNNSNKIGQLKILDTNLDKIIIISEIKDASLQEMALKEVPNFIDTFMDLFYKGNYELITKFDDGILNSIFNSKQINILNEYKKFTRDTIKEHFAQYICNHYDTLEEKDISIIATLIFNIDTSNSEEVSKQASSFVESILSNDDPLNAFNKVENIFLKNNLPYFAKIYLTFLTVHPDFKSYSFKNSNNGNKKVTSPTLNEISLLHKKVLVLTDLIKCSLKSNNLNIQEYLNRLEYGNQLYLNIKSNPNKELNEEDRIVLMEFRDTLIELNDNMLRKKSIFKTNDIIQDIKEMELLFGLNGESLADYIVSMYLGILGINSVFEARRYMLEQNRLANERNEKLASDGNYEIDTGDFIKSFNINYFFDMIQNGIVAKDYLGADMSTDCTALDTDLSRIWKDTTGMSINEIIDLKNKDSGMFGQGYIVIKDNPNTIRITKKENNETNSRLEEVNKNSIFDNKLEAFSNGTSLNISNPYGFRTGFSSTDISFIVYDEEGGIYNENIYKLIIPMVINGLYIPIVSKTRQNEKGEPLLLFSKEDYYKLRKKMDGLKHFGMNNYELSDNIDGEEYREIASQIDDSSKEIEKIKNEIVSELRDALGEEYSVISHINGKIIKNELQLLDTGSTGRQTNIPYDGDYDFIVRVNRDIDINQDRRKQFINRLISKFDIVEKGKTNDSGDIKGMVIRINDNEYQIDLSFTRKTDKVSYSTEMCIQDRLDTIRKEHGDKFKLVLSNIIFAKKYFKEHECYKKCSYGQGGLGGVGVENWILQNGGSFYDAALDFLSNAYDKEGNLLDFETFKRKYFVWDFGENFYTDRNNTNKSRNYSLHDNFINNMTAEGYYKMCNSLEIFINNYNLKNPNKGSNTSNRKHS